ncbi:AAA family ATPase [Oleisolibacter albus]|uniref:AAA family ATPase n=1 Tax=Oleisolibacter albus TaxID=2171757 RepID=UPI000DF14C23|nr:ATP-binding protein [Oleisolibacter albus]
MHKEQLASPDTTYIIDGFRSLRSFSITLTPGINVLVGPNGAGKTNFIDFLDFLDETISNGAATGISKVGGVARVFSMEIYKNSSPTLNAQVRGLAKIFDADQQKIFIFNYDYSIEIRFSKNHSSIYIAKEALKLWKLRTAGEENPTSSPVGTISVSRASPLEDLEPRIQVSPRFRTQNIRNPFRILPRYMSPNQKKDYLSRFSYFLLNPDESLLSGRHGFPAIDAVRQAITRGKSFNIVPEKARQPDDLTRPPLIARDGAGLSATLHHLQRAKNNRTYKRVNRLRRVSPELLSTILEWTKLVFPDLQDISVTQDPHTGKYIGYLHVGCMQTLRIPLQSASDGTLKWLSLVTLISTEGNAYSIEEPENFLHPKMQQFLIDLIRESFYSEHNTEYFIISTHSETLLNHCRAEELIIFKFEEGRTVCGRINNPDLVRQEINNTGFGLGYYYASNALP